MTLTLAFYMLLADYFIVPQIRDFFRSTRMILIPFALQRSVLSSSDMLRTNVCNVPITPPCANFSEPRLQKQTTVYVM